MNRQVAKNAKKGKETGLIARRHTRYRADRLVSLLSLGVLGDLAVQKDS
jgi:hypothetical protein